MGSPSHQRRFSRVLALLRSASSARPPDSSVLGQPLTSVASLLVAVGRLLRALCRPPVLPFLRVWPLPNRPGPDELSPAQAARCLPALGAALFQGPGLVAGAPVSEPPPNAPPSPVS